MKLPKRFGRRLIALSGAVLIALSILGMPGVMVEQAYAGCMAPGIGFGRWKWCGFYHNGYQDSGGPVRNGGVPGHINLAQELIDQVWSDYTSGNTNWHVSALFFVHTMIGRHLGTPKDMTWGEYVDFRDRVYTYANLGENGSTSYGVNGSIEWFTWQHTPCGIVNTYHQPAFADVAPYTDNPGNSDCANPAVQSDFIIFRDTAGNVRYMIRRICMNPMGNIDPLSTAPPPNYNVVPNINVTVNGGGPSTVAEVGDTVQFTYTVTNNGPGPSPTITGCSFHRNDHPGYFPTPSPPETTGQFAPFTYTCPPPLGSGATHNLGTETVNVTSGNVTLCRTLRIFPGSQANDIHDVNVCIPIASKPYLKVFGGDVMAGSGLANASGTCTNNNNAAVTSWNRNSGFAFAGAGAQYAVTALSTITDFASGQVTGAATASPSNLAFANTATNAAAGNFGGTFGAAPCIKDYFGGMPSGATTLAASSGISPLTTGNYLRTGAFTTSGGNVNPSQRMTLYVDGDVTITDNITYPGNWDASTMPHFRIVARGNIYIGSNVTQLDGIYIAQRNGASGGTIYTCASGSTPIALSGSFHSTCNNPLTINGAFVANSVEFLRTRGSQGQATAAETYSSGTIAEKFIYSPATWIAQPDDGGVGSGEYDAITSLPPVL